MTAPTDRVRAKTGVPVAGDFFSTQGTPIVVDTTASTGGAYYMDDAGSMVQLGNYAYSSSYVPTVTAGTGAFTTVSAVMKYVAIGKMVNFQCVITITTNGTAASFVQFTLPVSAADVGAGYYYAVTGTDVGPNLDITGYIYTSTLCAIFTPAGAYPGGGGKTLVVQGTYFT